MDGATVLATVGTEHLHLEGSVLYRWREVLDRHERQWWQTERRATCFTRAGREAGLEARHRR